MKKLFTCTAIYMLTIAATFASADLHKENQQAQRYEHIRNMINSPTSSEISMRKQAFNICKDYGVRRHIINEILYEIVGATHIAPDSRKPSSLKENPIDARQLAVLEYLWTDTYHNKHWEHDEPQNPRPQAAAILKEGYNQYAYYIYTKQLSQTPKFKEVLSNIQLKIAFPTQHTTIETSTLKEILAKQYPKAKNYGFYAPLIITLQDIKSIISTYGTNHQYSFQDNTLFPYQSYLSAWINDTSAPHIITIGDDIINGTEYNDYIIGSFGNDHLIGLAGDDILIGDSKLADIPCEFEIKKYHNNTLQTAYNDYLEGGDGNDIYRFFENWGQDIIDNCTANPNDIDTIHFTNTVAPDNLEVSRQNNNLILQENNSSNKITIKNYFSPNCHKIKYVYFFKYYKLTKWSQATLEKKYSRYKYYYTQTLYTLEKLWNKIGELTADIFYKLIIMTESKPKPVKLNLPPHLTKKQKKNGAD